MCLLFQCSSHDCERFASVNNVMSLSSFPFLWYSCILHAAPVAYGSSSDNPTYSGLVTWMVNCWRKYWYIQIMFKKDDRRCLVSMTNQGKWESGEAIRVVKAPATNTTKQLVFTICPYTNYFTEGVVLTRFRATLIVGKKGRRKIGKCFPTKFSSLRLASTYTSVVPDPVFGFRSGGIMRFFWIRSRIGFHFCSSRIQIIQNALNTF